MIMYIFLWYSLNFYYCFNSFFFFFLHFGTSVFFDTAQCFQYSPMLQHASVLHFFLFSDRILFCYVDPSHSGYPFISWWTFELFILFFFTIMSNAAMNINVQVFVWTYVFSSFMYIPGNENAGSFGSSVLNFLSNCQTVFKGVAPICIPISSLLGFHFSCNLLTQLSIFFYYCCLSGCEVVSH